MEMDDITLESSLIDKVVGARGCGLQNRCMHCDCGMKAFSTSRGKEGGRYGGAKVISWSRFPINVRRGGLGDDVDAACACHQSACLVLLRAASDGRYMLILIGSCQTLKTTRSEMKLARQTSR